MERCNRQVILERIYQLYIEFVTDPQSHTLFSSRYKIASIYSDYQLKFRLQSSLHFDVPKPEGFISMRRKPDRISCQSSKIL